MTPAEAEQRVRDNLVSFPREDCPLAQAHGRVLRAPLRADRDLPPFDRVTMDGYALRSAAALKTRTFRVIGTQAAGVRPLSLTDELDTCVEIMTGAVLPLGADCVVPYEQAVRSGDRVELAANARVGSGENVHAKGSDHRSGDEIVAPGVRLTGAHIAVAASIGAATLTVSAQPSIAIVATGDELVDVDAPVSAHQIRRSNEYALRTALLARGFGRVERFHLRDVRHEVEQRLRQVIAGHDVLVITGGVSKGKYDFLPGALEALGVRKLVHGVAQRPGKPFWFGVTPRQTPVFALPGNPVSAYTCLHRYVLPGLALASGETPRPSATVVLGSAVTFAPALAYLLPVRLRSSSAGQLIADPTPTHTSGDFAGLVGTDGFIELSAERSEFPAGFATAFWPWS